MYSNHFNGTIFDSFGMLPNLGNLFHEKSQVFWLVSSPSSLKLSQQKLSSLEFVSTKKNMSKRLQLKHY